MALNLKIKKEGRIFKKESFKNLSLKLILIILGIMLGIAGTFLYIKNFGIPFKAISQTAAKAEEEKLLQDTIAKAGKLLILPTDETPVMATILDVEKLTKTEPFYVNAQNGDVLLMYQKALKAIIYSPKKDIIVNVGPIYVPPATETNQENSTPSTEEVEDNSASAE